MKKLILLALLAISMLPIYAQTSIGVIGGYNLNSLYPKIKTEILGYDVSPISGWRAGLIADQHLWKKFYLQPQLIFNQKGYNYSFNNTAFSTYADIKRRLLYFELQVNLLFKQQIGKGKLFAGAGPYIGRGIAGVEIVDGHSYNADIGQMYHYIDYYLIKYRNKRPVFDPYDNEGHVNYVKPYDVGFNVLAGYELKNGLFINTAFSLGLNDTGYTRGYEIKNTYVGVTIGYFLKRFS